MARWWAARALEMEKENSSVIPVRGHRSLLVPCQALLHSLLSCNSHSEKRVEILDFLEEWTVGLLIFWCGEAEMSFRNEPWFNGMTGHWSAFPTWVFWSLTALKCYQKALWVFRFNLFKIRSPSSQFIRSSFWKCCLMMYIVVSLWWMIHITMWCFGCDDTNLGKKQKLPRTEVKSVWLFSVLYTLLTCVSM